MPIADDRIILQKLFAEAVRVADPMLRIPDALPKKPAGRVLVIGAGKASARMAEAVEDVWGPCEGLVITRYGYGREVSGIEIVEASHPVPDAAGHAATARLLELLDGVGADDFVLSLISGGGSALLVQPVEGVSLSEKQEVNAALLASGAPIDQMNIVRKHLSQVKGGQLAAQSYPARMLSLMISDVPGDDPAAIASGPTVGEPTTAADAQKILRDWAIDVPQSVHDALMGTSSVAQPGSETLSRVENVIVAAPSQSLEAAAQMAARMGMSVEILGDAIEGEARELAVEHAAMALARRDDLAAGDPPVLLLSGGECTVTRRGDGVGGPNAEYALALAVALDGAAGISAIACDTDGVDGAAEVAGAVIDETTIGRAGPAAARALEINDAHSLFGDLGDQVVTGPTLTNVNDFRAILIRPQ